MLLENGARPDLVDEQGQSAFAVAVQFQDKKTIHQLLANDADPLPVFANTIKIGALHHAEFLLESLSDNSDLDPFLVSCVKAAAIPLARIVLEKGASPNARSKQGDPVLNMAARDGNLPMVRLLLENGVDVHLKDTEGRSAYLLAEGPLKAEIKTAIRAYFKN